MAEHPDVAKPLSTHVPLTGKVQTYETTSEIRSDPAPQHLSSTNLDAGRCLAS